jgi:hypothetical protein
MVGIALRSQGMDRPLLATRDTMPGHILRMIRKELEDGFDQDG